MTVVYLAGPMRGIPEWNAPAFRDAADDLRHRGYDVVSPLEMDEAEGAIPAADEPLPFATYMARDLPRVCEADAVVLLPGWQKSVGATLEAHVASAVGKPLLRYPDLAPARHPLSAELHDELRALGQLHDRKQADYGLDGDPFANVRASEEWGLRGWIGALVRLNDKVRRLQALARNGGLENESAEDSMRDIAVYALIALVLYRESGRQRDANALCEGARDASEPANRSVTDGGQERTDTSYRRPAGAQRGSSRQHSRDRSDSAAGTKLEDLQYAKTSAESSRDERAFHPAPLVPSPK